MAIIRLIEESEATGRVKEIFSEVRSLLHLPFVPQIFRALAARPQQLESVWMQARELFGGGALDLRTKCMAAMAVAAAQQNPYFIPVYAMALKRLGASDEEIAELLQMAGLAVSLNTLASGFGLEPEV